jgi:predicted amidohydrolase YtcJ
MDRSEELADSILLGEVITLDANSTIAEAVAVAGGRIIAAGSAKDVLGRSDGNTEIHDFGDAAIIPGFNDTHAHMDTEGMKLVHPPLTGCRSIADVTARIGALAAETPLGNWVVTMPVGEPPHYFGGPEILEEARMPTRDELDHAAPDHPVCILPPSGYWGKPPCYMALNSRALALNGIGKETEPSLLGIEILKDETGEPTGVFVDNNPREAAQLDLMAAVPRFALDDRREAVAQAMQLYHTKGTTSIYEGHGCSPDVIGIYRDLWQSGRLTMRVGLVLSPPWSAAAEAEAVMRDWLAFARGHGLGDEWLKISGVYIDYGGDPVAAEKARARANDTGYWSFHWLANTPEEFEALCMAAARYDLRVHTIASAGKQRDILPVLARVDAAFGISGRRWVLEHLSLSDPEDLEEMKRLGLGVTLIPRHHLWKNGATFFDLGDAESAHVVPAKQLRELGIPFAAGTDNTPFNPLAVMESLIERTERVSGRLVGEDGRISAEAALRSLTTDGAWLTFDENVKGRLAAGQLADCAVLSENPLKTEPGALQQIECLATMVGGKFVFGA